MRFYFFAQLAFDLIGVFEKVVDASELVNEFHGSLLTDTGTPWEVVGRVAHQRQQVNNLICRGDTIFLANFLWTHFFIAAPVTWTELINVLAHQLTIVLVGGEHIGLNTQNARFHRKCTDDIISFEAVDL